MEGAYNEGGRTPSIWDVFCEDPNHCSGENGMPLEYYYHCRSSLLGNVADNHYHLIPEDVQLMKEMNINHYRYLLILLRLNSLMRMSLSWSRLLPNGVGEVGRIWTNFNWKFLVFILRSTKRPLNTTIWKSTRS